VSLFAISREIERNSFIFVNWKQNEFRSGCDEKGFNRCFPGRLACTRKQRHGHQRRSDKTSIADRRETDETIKYVSFLTAIFGQITQCTEIKWTHAWLQLTDIPIRETVQRKCFIVNHTKHVQPSRVRLSSCGSHNPLHRHGVERSPFNCLRCVAAL